MRIFWRSSGMVKTALSFCMVGPLAAEILKSQILNPKSEPMCLGVCVTKCFRISDFGFRIFDTPAALRCLFSGRPRLHLVFLWFPGWRDDFGRPALGRNL